MLDELEKLLKRLVEIRNSSWCDDLKKRHMSWFLALTALGSTAEILLKMIADDTRHDQW